MDVIVALEHRFLRTPDGATWTQTMFAYQFWQRYLEVFDGVKILARASEAASPPDNWKRVDGSGVSLIPIPYYVGPLQYLLRASDIARTARNAVKPQDAVILRVPSRIMATII